MQPHQAPHVRRSDALSSGDRKSGLPLHFQAVLDRFLTVLPLALERRKGTAIIRRSYGARARESSFTRYIPRCGDSISPGSLGGHPVVAVVAVCACGVRLPSGGTVLFRQIASVSGLLAMN